MLIESESILYYKYLVMEVSFLGTLYAYARKSNSSAELPTNLKASMGGACRTVSTGPREIFSAVPVACFSQIYNSDLSRSVRRGTCSFLLSIFLNSSSIS